MSPQIKTSNLRGHRMTRSSAEWAELRRQARQLQREGKLNREIAVALKISESAISKWAERGTRQRSLTPGRRRECLKCGRKFKSFGQGNRLCEKCRDSNQKIAPLGEGIMGSPPLWETL